MHWQEACSKSPYGNAWRYTRDNRYMVRYSDGSATVSCNRSELGVRAADRVEIDGFDDWEPVRAPAPGT